MDRQEIRDFLAGVHPYDTLEADQFGAVAGAFRCARFASGDLVYGYGTPLAGVFLIYRGAVEVCDARGCVISELGPRNSFGERGVLRDGFAVTQARAVDDCEILVLPPAAFHAMYDSAEAVRRFFDRGPGVRKAASGTGRLIRSVMEVDVVTCPGSTPAQEAAALLSERQATAVCVVTRFGTAEGIVTLGDLARRVLAQGVSPLTPLSQIMSRDLLCLPPEVTCDRALELMQARGVDHLPVVEGCVLVGMVRRSDLLQVRDPSTTGLVARIMRAADVAAMTQVMEQLPIALSRMVGQGLRHGLVTRSVSDVADAVTRRLLDLATARLGPPPVPFVWAACGSQGRQEQTGVSDQDNVLILDDRFTEDMRPYFAELAQYVSDGLNDCGYVYCPGGMMATTARWCQPLSVWRGYFRQWIDRPDTSAQMLASVMFDLRAIFGEDALLTELQEATMQAAQANSIFVAHMVSNALTHSPPLGLLRGLATIRSGEHRNQIDMKLSGVVPVVDLGRIYALQNGLRVVNTQSRLQAAMDAGGLSQSGGRDLLAAYELIADMRLEHQARQIRRGEAADNYVVPARLSDFERSHLRDAFVVVKSMQSAAGHGRAWMS
ncbi:putative nucleotidyltransferase substrate binding domain-containing protein [Sagittula sp. SSi028]|uniref:putative nucleotidyltransferase substrate binding domain-containing protein n=1 Tax=Sagittula sp. SSi028 TaxID=3400636 RepID=UPI003AF9FA61